VSCATAQDAKSQDRRPGTAGTSMTSARNSPMEEHYQTREEPMSTESQNAEIEREYTRIGISSGERLPMPRGLRGASDYLVFLRQVPDSSGVQGFTATLEKRAKRA
jgi:hypothetical protein